MSSGWHPWNRHRRATRNRLTPTKAWSMWRKAVWAGELQQQWQKRGAVRNRWWLSLALESTYQGARQATEPEKSFPTANSLCWSRDARGVNSSRRLQNHHKPREPAGPLRARVSPSESELRDAASRGNGSRVSKTFASAAGTEVGKQQMPMEQTAQAVTLGYTGAPLKLSIFLMSVIAKMPKTTRKSNTEGRGGMETLKKWISLSSFDFPFMQRFFFFFNLLAKNNQCGESGSTLWKKK